MFRNINMKILLAKIFLLFSIMYIFSIPSFFTVCLLLILPLCALCYWQHNIITLHVVQVRIIFEHILPCNQTHMQTDTFIIACHLCDISVIASCNVFVSLFLHWTHHKNMCALWHKDTCVCVFCSRVCVRV